MRYEFKQTYELHLILLKNVSIKKKKKKQFSRYIDIFKVYECYFGIAHFFRLCQV